MANRIRFSNLQSGVPIRITDVAEARFNRTPPYLAYSVTGEQEDDDCIFIVNMLVHDCVDELDALAFAYAELRRVGVEVIGYA